MRSCVRDVGPQDTQGMLLIKGMARRKPEEQAMEGLEMEDAAIRLEQDTDGDAGRGRGRGRGRGKRTAKKGKGKGKGRSAKGKEERYHGVPLLFVGMLECY